MEFLQIKYFIAAAEAQSFTAAAVKYGVPTSDISQTVKRLEGELETQLFVRSANRVRLSHEGKVFLEGARNAMNELEGARLRLRECSGTVSGEIRLLVLTNRRVVTKAIDGFRSLYPEVSFNISHTDGSGDSFDIVISDERPKRGSFDELPLVREKFLLAVSEECEPQGFDRKKPSLQAFRSSRFISMPENSSLYRITRKICSKGGFLPTIGIICDDPYYLRKYVEMGLGAAFVPSFSWQGLMPETVGLYDICDYCRTTYMFLSKTGAGSRAVREFVPILRESFG